MSTNHSEICQSEEIHNHWIKINPSQDIFPENHPYFEVVHSSIREILNNLSNQLIVRFHMDRLKILIISEVSSDSNSERNAKRLSWFEETNHLMGNLTNGIIPPRQSGFNFKDIFSVAIHNPRELETMLRCMRFSRSFWLKNFRELCKNILDDDNLLRSPSLMRSGRRNSRRSPTQILAHRLMHIRTALLRQNPELYYECELLNNPEHHRYLATSMDSSMFETKFEYLRTCLSVDLCPRQIRTIYSTSPDESGCEPIQFILKRILGRHTVPEDDVGEEDLAIRLIQGHPNLKAQFKLVKEVLTDKESFEAIGKVAPRLYTVLMSLEQSARNPRSLFQSASDVIRKQINPNELRSKVWENASKVSSSVSCAGPGQQYKSMLGNVIYNLGIPVTVAEYMLNNRPFELFY